MKEKTAACKNERGSTIVIMAVSMIFMIAMAAIAIDVVVLYVVRSEAQRAADAAALAGAHQFVVSGLTSGTINQSALCDGSGSGLAQEAAIAAARQNVVGGQQGLVQASDIVCDFSRTVSMNGATVPVNPRITVTVRRTNLPTFFSHIWSNAFVANVTASATAEAFNESGNSVPTLSSCLKPFLLPNTNPGQGGNFTGQPFVDVGNNGTIHNPGVYPSGVIGETFTISPVNITGPQPGQFYQLLFADQPTMCPSGCGGTGDTYQSNIQCCNTDGYTCGGTTYQADFGLSPNATDTSNGVQCMIHGRDVGSGADDIVNLNSPPFQFIAGSNNPVVSVRGNPVTTSNSLITVPLFNGTATNPVQVIGFLQLFVRSVDATGNIQVTIVNVVGCSSGIPTRNPVQGGGISPVPVRLVQASGS